MSFGVSEVEEKVEEEQNKVVEEEEGRSCGVRKGGLDAVVVDVRLCL